MILGKIRTFCTTKIRHLGKLVVHSFQDVRLWEDPVEAQLFINQIGGML